VRQETDATAINPFALWAWPRFLTNRSPPVHWTRNICRVNVPSNNCSIELTKLDWAEISHLGSEIKICCFFCHPVLVSLADGRFEKRS
jgi:hypothetical protein